MKCWFLAEKSFKTFYFNLKYKPVKNFKNHWKLVSRWNLVVFPVGFIGLPSVFIRKSVLNFYLRCQTNWVFLILIRFSTKNGNRWGAVFEFKTIWWTTTWKCIPSLFFFLFPLLLEKKQWIWLKFYRIYSHDICTHDTSSLTLICFRLITDNISRGYF